MDKVKEFIDGIFADKKSNEYKFAENQSFGFKLYHSIDLLKDVNINENDVKLLLDYLYKYNHKDIRNIILIIHCLSQKCIMFKNFREYIVDNDNYSDTYRLLILQIYNLDSIKFICGLKNVSDDVINVIHVTDDNEFITLFNAVENKKKLLEHVLNNNLRLIYNENVIHFSNNEVIDIFLDCYNNHIVDIAIFNYTLGTLTINQFLNVLVSSKYKSDTISKIFEKMFLDDNLEYIEYNIKYLLTLESITPKQHEQIIKKISQLKINYDIKYKNERYFVVNSIKNFNWTNQILRYLLPYLYHINFKYEIPNKLIKKIFKCLGLYRFFKVDIKKIIEKLKPINKIPRNSLYQVLGTKRVINNDSRLVVDMLMETYDIKIDSELLNNRNVGLVQYLYKKYPDKCKKLDIEILKKYRIKN